MDHAIRMEKSTRLKPKPEAQEKLGFGKYFTDHMFLMDYSEELGWYDPRIVPYAPLTMDPASMVFHYGQAIFEGLKAFKAKDGRILLFRPDQNAKRMNASCERMNMPLVDEAFFVEALQKLVTLDASWIPDKAGAFLYVRPFMIATEAALGVRASNRYLFAVIMSPVEGLYEAGMEPVRIRVEDEFVRAAPGGTGTAKTAGNYAGSLRAQQLAKEDGCSQVMWLDASERAYIEEVGSMNVFFKINGVVCTPELNGSILDGITRKSVLHLLEQWEVPVQIRRISIDELVQAAKENILEEAFGTGTAAVISPIGSLRWKGQEIIINEGKMGPISSKVYDTLTGIQGGEIRDPYEWVIECSEKI
jgi:branched-chain amino acid aminotransferase